MIKFLLVNKSQNYRYGSKININERHESKELMGEKQVACNWYYTCVINDQHPIAGAAAYARHQQEDGRGAEGYLRLLGEGTAAPRRTKRWVDLRRIPVIITDETLKTIVKEIET
ncbi:unnamed protein product [Euphydryas editha]|uniref:Uncharacterized protein n=1 Tax=Euphydryas editha TaxID=104508 RepID=A0AAU9U3R6_EUPED|nr:unnamed protein product [Euphydryas editha]